MSSVSFLCIALVFSAFVTCFYPFPAGSRFAEHIEELHRNDQVPIAQQCPVHQKGQGVHLRHLQCLELEAQG